MYIPDYRYPYNWNRLRFYIFKKYNYTCQLCGRYAKGNLHLHHIIPLGMGGTNSIDNLIPLCSECHYRIHFGDYDFRKLINSQNIQKGGYIITE